jgi:hypothetical protein
MAIRRISFNAPAPLVACLELIKYMCYKENKGIPTVIQKIEETTKNQSKISVKWQPRINPKTLSTNATTMVPIALTFIIYARENGKSVIEIAASTDAKTHDSLLGWVVEYWEGDFSERIDYALKNYPLGLLQIGQEQRILELHKLANLANEKTLLIATDALMKGDNEKAYQLIVQVIHPPEINYSLGPTAKTLEISSLILSELLEQPEAVARCLFGVKGLNSSQNLIQYRLNLLGLLPNTSNDIEKFRDRINNDLDNADLHYELAIKLLASSSLFLTVDKEESSFWKGLKGEEYWVNRLQFSAQFINDAALELNIALFLGLNSPDRIDKANYLLADIKKFEIKDLSLEESFSLLQNEYIQKILGKRKENILGNIADQRNAVINNPNEPMLHYNLANSFLKSLPQKYPYTGIQKQMWDYLVPDILISSNTEEELNIVISLGLGKPIEDIKARLSLANLYAMKGELSKRNYLLTEAVALTKKYLRRSPYDINALTIQRDTFSMLGDQNGVVSMELQLSRARSLLNTGLRNSTNELAEGGQKLPQQVTGIELEEKVKQLLEFMGLKATTTKASGDGGIDVVAFSSTPIYSGKYIVQCKDWTKPVGEPVVRDLFGVVISEGANKGILITTGKFTNAAYRFAEGKQIELIDGDELLGY